jgi:hypothetical protein
MGMNELDALISDTLRADAQEAAMATNTSQEREVLESRLDEVDRHSRNRRTFWGAVAVAAAVVVIGVGVTMPRMDQHPTPSPGQAGSPKPVYTSTDFAVPFTLGSLPTWADLRKLNEQGDHPTNVTWGRGPCGPTGNECVGLAFERYTGVPSSTRLVNGVRATYASYLRYIDGLVKSGALRVTDRTTTVVGGRPAVVFTAVATRDLKCGLGSDATGNCDSFFAGDTGRYAVVDTGRLDPAGQLLVIWTRGHGLGPAEDGWLDQFDQMLSTVKFTGPTKS